MGIISGIYSVLKVGADTGQKQRKPKGNKRMTEFDKAKSNLTIEQLTEWVIYDNCKKCPMSGMCEFEVGMGMPFRADVCREKVRAFYESEVKE
jgi:hypothetical protein